MVPLTNHDSSEGEQVVVIYPDKIQKKKVVPTRPTIVSLRDHWAEEEALAPIRTRGAVAVNVQHPGKKRFRDGI